MTGPISSADAFAYYEHALTDFRLAPPGTPTAELDRRLLLAMAAQELYRQAQEEERHAHSSRP